MLRLSRKADVDLNTRLVTSIYLSEAEFSVLAVALKGARIQKLRHRLHGPTGISMLVDEFQGPLAGLLLAEAEFNTADALADFPMPTFAIREVTEDSRYSGGKLAVDGLPQDQR